MSERTFAMQFHDDKTVSNETACHPSPTSRDIITIKPRIVVHEAKRPLPLQENESEKLMLFIELKTNFKQG